jgi:hypothetical protein
MERALMQRALLPRALMAFTCVLCLGSSGAGAAEPGFDSEAECRTISAADSAGCRCQGLYFASKFGPDEGLVALHLVGRSYVSEPQVTAAALYERFGAARLDGVARRILETHGEVASYCPFSANLAD